jgi:hypothetical protein
MGTAANRAGHGEALPLTRAPQRELRGGTPLGSRARACPLGLAGPRGFPTGTAASRAGHGEDLPLTRAPQRELRGGTPPGSRARACPMLD